MRRNPFRTDGGELDPDVVARAHFSEALALEIARLLAGVPCEVQGAALADAVACWIAGHVGTPAGRTLGDYRVEVLSDFIKLVGSLVPFHDDRIRAAGPSAGNA